MGEDWESWASIIRSCILTSKTPLTLWEINRDTKMLEGRDIPFRQLNFRTLEDMMRKVPGLKVFQLQGKTVVQAIPTEETAHISKMVRLQKPAKKKPRTLPPVFNRFSTGNRRPPTYRTTPNRNNNVPQNRYSAQNRFNVPNNYSRPSSAEPQKRPGPQVFFSPSAPSTPSPSQSSFEQQRKTPPPLLQTQVPISTPQKPPLLPTPPPQQRNVHFAPAPTPLIQQRASPAAPSSVQQRLDQQAGLLGHAPKTSSIAQRLNVAQTPRTVPKPLDDPRLTLNSYAEARKLPLPIYKDLPMKDKNIYSSVTVDSKKYRSYPKEAKTKDDAEKLAAQAALDALLGKDRAPNVTTSDTQLVIKRVSGIVNDHPNGLFESSLVDTYIAKYNEGLPKNWLKLVEFMITVDVAANNLTILSPQSDDVQGNRSTSPVVLTEPEMLKLNNMEEFWLHIYVVYNTTDIWGVIIDENHSDKIDELAKEMKIFYDTHDSKPPTVTPGKYYAVFDSEWHRVRCIKVDAETQSATVFFIDRGDEDVFSVARLREFRPEFCRLPAQSVRLSMSGLEVFADCDETQTLIEELLVDKDVYVRSMKVDQRSMGTVSAQLYLERGEEDVNVNELLRAEFLQKIVDPTIYLEADKVAQEVHISYVSEKAVYIQVKSKGLKQFNTLMSSITKDYLSNIYFKRRPVLRFDAAKIYVTKNVEDKNWYRVKIVKIENENLAQAFCIDVGNTISVTRNDLIVLEDLSELLAVYPNQAVQVRLHKISPIMFDKKMAAHLRVLAPKTEVFYMKVVGNLDKIPMVEFYKRTENNYLASLNDTLALEPEITSKDDNNNAKPRIRNDRSSIGSRAEFPLKTPFIPSIGSYFDVYITMAAHPGNFTVQPLNTVHELEKLMTELSTVCASYTGPPLTPSSVKVGSMYAAKYDDDGRWYRAYVSKVIGKNVCAVYFCDYGDYRAVSLEQLQPLQNQFYDLPYQAIKAKLYGVTPKLKGDWTVKDSLRFNDLIVARSFVSVIKSCDVDNMTSGETILGLELIDTSTSEDIYITNVLVNEKRAEKLEELKV